MIQNDVNGYVICSLILNLLFGSIKEIASIIPGLLISKKIIRKVSEFYSIKEEVFGGAAFSMGDIKISNLSFSYNRFNDIINNFNSSIRKGEKIILKGESGKGKSTLCKLLNKELLDYKGNIYINNKDIKDISNESFRDNVFYVSQNEGIFKATIKDNILLGRQVDEKYFKTVYSICHLDRVEKKYFFGLNTFIKDGSYLSGGERQLVLLARSLISKPKILILDEVLSEVNESLEYSIIKDIFKYFKNNTIIYISHKNTCNKLGRLVYV
jgi:ABC-type bacteriocin/lantibiotic exporter with double-glycine peptidase domain